MPTLTQATVTTPGSETPGLTALADLLRATIAALEAVAKRDLAVEAIYNAGREDERAAMAGP